MSEYTLKLNSKFEDRIYEHEFSDSALNSIKSKAIAKIINSDTDKGRIAAKETFLLAQALHTLFTYVKENHEAQQVKEPSKATTTKRVQKATTRRKKSQGKKTGKQTTRKNTGTNATATEHPSSDKSGERGT